MFRFRLFYENINDLMLNYFLQLYIYIYIYIYELVIFYLILNLIVLNLY